MFVQKFNSSLKAGKLHHGVRDLSHPQRRETFVKSRKDNKKKNILNKTIQLSNQTTSKIAGHCEMQLVPILEEHLSLEQDDNEEMSTLSPYSPLVLKANTKQCEKRIWLLSLRAFFGDLSASGIIARDINLVILVTTYPRIPSPAQSLGTPSRRLLAHPGWV